MKLKRELSAVEREEQSESGEPMLSLCESEKSWAL